MCVTKSRLALGQSESWLVDIVVWEILTNQKPKKKNKTKAMATFSYQPLDPSFSPNGIVSQSKCDNMTKRFGREGLDLFHVALKTIY